MKETVLKMKLDHKIITQPIGFPGSICLSDKSKGKIGRAKLLRNAKAISLILENEETAFIDSECKFIRSGHRKHRDLKLIRNSGQSKVLLFRNIFNSPDKEENRWFSPGTLYLSSSLKKAGFQVILSDSKISLKKNEFITEKDNLEKILKQNPDLNFIGISLCEDFFEQAKELVKFLRARTRAFIGIGGIMPTLTPEHVFVHLSEVNFLVRGAGEEVFPLLAKILTGKYINSNLTKSQIGALLRLEGLLFQNKYMFICSFLNKINVVKNYDRSILDFKFLDQEDLTEGLNLFSSRGCFNNCFFCTTPGKGGYVGKSFQNLTIILKDYSKRLKEIFGNGLPAHAFKLSFNDDDFLADWQRAKSFFSYLKNQPFLINFFQTGINSFFRGGIYTNKANRELIQSICPSIFSPGKRKIYVGTENFSDRELKRLGKGYNFLKVEEVVKSLSKRKIHQVHHLIASNQLTSPEDILDNLVKIAVFKVLYGEYFNILVPIVPYLVSLFPSLSYKICLKKKRGQFLNIRQNLSLRNYPEYNYPLVENDIPINEITRALVPMLYKLFSVEKDYIKIIDATLVNLLFLQEKMPLQKKEIKQLIERYKNYPELIYRKTNFRIENDRNNLQLMITRRCQLRCKYCSIVKKNVDMGEGVLFKAIDLLFTSSRDHLRLDFTGGEPLLRFDLVKKGVEYAKRLAKWKYKTISFYLVTNLIALTEDMADFFTKENFFLELSLDGEEKFHNLYKRTKTPEINPYRFTVAQLDKVFSRKINNYAVMVTTPSTVKHLCKNFYHLLKLGFRRIGINYALGLIWNEMMQKEFFGQLDLIKKKYRPFIDRGIIKLTNLASRNEPAILNSEIMVDVDGKTYFLTDLLFERDAGKKIIALGELGDLKSLNEIPLTKFRTLNRLFDCYTSCSTRQIIVNNIVTGNLVRDYFETWKKKSN